jgi:hypothetical protein
MTGSRRLIDKKYPLPYCSTPSKQDAGRQQETSIQEGGRVSPSRRQGIRPVFLEDPCSRRQAQRRCRCTQRHCQTRTAKVFTASEASLGRSLRSREARSPDQIATTTNTPQTTTSHAECTEDNSAQKSAGPPRRRQSGREEKAR